MNEAQRLEVGRAEAGQRLDVFLAARLGLSRAQTRRLLARGAVAVAGRRVEEAAKGLALRSGDAVEVAPFTAPEHQAARPEPDVPLSVCAEGRGWIAVDKPAGVAVHPLREDEGGTLLNALLARHPEMHGVGEGALRSGVVHRLDVDTSGVVLFATAQVTWQRLREAFTAHRVEKVYHAVVSGRISDVGSLALPLLTARHRPARVRIATPEEAERARGVRMARLSWQVLERFADATLLEVRPVTGFLHQIRVLLAAQGHPLLGDRSYAPPEVAGRAPRHLLHAASLCFEEIRAESPDAPDFAQALAALRAGR